MTGEFMKKYRIKLKKKEKLEFRRICGLCMFCLFVWLFQSFEDGVTGLFFKSILIMFNNERD